jgi:predicted phosphodiesterase
VRKVYLIVALAVIGGLAGLVLWYQHFGAPNKIIADLLPGVNTAHATQTTFAVIGDNEGDNDTYRNLLGQIAADKDVQFVLHVGDLTANGGTQELSEVQALHTEIGLTVPMYAVPGNHDIKNDKNRSVFTQAYGELPRSLDLGNIQLVLLDNADRKVGFTADELSWLENDLSSLQIRKQSNQVTILAYHRPFAYPLADFLGDDETATSRKSNNAFLAILARNPVDHIFTGHIHTALDYTMVTKEDATNRATKTVPVTISGGGGQPIQSAFGGLVKENYHWLKVTVTNTDIKTEIKPL